MSEALQDQQAERLTLIAQRIGFALWQLQELEGVAVHYVVLMTQATRGMGSAAGNALLESAQSRTFGGTVREITKAGLLDADLQPRIEKILSERNWLVHKSRGTSRNAVFSDSGMTNLVGRVDAVAEEALSLLRILGSKIEDYVREQGVSMKDVDERASALLEQWHASDES